MNVQKDLLFTVTVRGTPVSKGNHTPRQRGRKIYITDKAGKRLESWEYAIHLAVKMKFQKPLSGPFGLEIEYLFRRPAYHKNPKKARFWHIVKPDIDKIHRAVQDALTNAAYIDDCQVAYSADIKRYCQDCETEGVVISVFRLKEPNDD